MFGGFKKKMDEAKKKAEEVKERMNSIYVRGAGSSGEVHIVMTANKAVVEVKIQPEAHDKGATFVETQMAEAFQSAIQQAEGINAAEMQAVAKEHMPSIPGMDTSKLFS